MIYPNPWKPCSMAAAPQVSRCLCTPQAPPTTKVGRPWDVGRRMSIRRRGPSSSFSCQLPFHAPLLRSSAPEKSAAEGGRRCLSHGALLILRSIGGPGAEARAHRRCLAFLHNCGGCLSFPPVALDKFAIAPQATPAPQANSVALNCARHTRCETGVGGVGMGSSHEWAGS